MISYELFAAGCMTWLLSMGLQWWFMTRTHRQRMASLKARYVRASKEAQGMLAHCRRQIADLQKSLQSRNDASAALRPAAAPVATLPASDPAPVHGRSAVMESRWPSEQFKEDPYVAAVLQFAETRPMPEPAGMHDTRGFPMDLLSPATLQLFSDTVTYEPASAARMPAPRRDVWSHERLA